MRGFYKGMSSPLAGVAAINSLLFGFFGAALRKVSNTPDNPTLGEIFAAGSISGFINGFFSTPMELVKIRLQNQKMESVYRGPIDCVKRIVKDQGVKGLFRGLPTTLMRETPSYGGKLMITTAYFASYELFCRSVPEQSFVTPSVGMLLAGGLAGIIAWMATYPFDVVKTRLQSRINFLI
jgi:solute carrier family 25 carnitine/acylcarnitine transporter 20/29